jgi:4-amino-4-deoxy-L-arabinose transferase-like glycosyltransferase
MPLLWMALFVGLLPAMGYLALSAVCGHARRSAIDVAGLSLALGAGLVGTLLLAASLAGATPSRMLVAGLWAGTIAAALVLGRVDRLVRASWRTGPFHWRDVAMAIPLALAAYLTAAVVVHALAFPIFEWDAFAIWGLKAKVLFHESLRSDPGYFQDRSLSFSHLDYPPLTSLLTGGVYGALGRVDDRLGKVLLPVLYIALGLTTFTALRWKLDRTRAAFLAALMMALPPCVRWAGSGNADVALTLFYGVSVYFTARWAASGEAADLAIVVLTSAFAALTKNDGLGLALLNGLAVVLSLPRRHWRARAGLVLLALAGAGVLLAPWTIWNWTVPRTHEDYGARLSIASVFQNLPRLPIVIRAFAAETTAVATWGALWLLLILAAALGWRAFRERHVIVVWSLLAAQLAMYAAIYLVTPWNVEELLAVSLDRVLLHATPAAVLLIGYHWAQMAAPRTSQPAGPRRVSSLTHRAAP